MTDLPLKKRLCLALMLLAAVAALLAFNADALAQDPPPPPPPGAAAAVDDTWPAYPFTGKPHTIDRGPGGYLSVTKIILLWIVFLFWVRTTDWVSRDCYIHQMPTAIWTPVVFFPFVVGFFLFGLTLPVFPLGFLLYLVSYVAPLAVYIIQRNAKVHESERVLTPDHFRHIFAGKAGAFGVKISKEKKLAHQLGAPVEIKAVAAATEAENQANLISARQSPGFVPTKEILADAVDHRAEKIMLDYTAEAVAVKYLVDGVWHDNDPRDRETMDLVLAVLKKIANLKPEERRARQEGRMLIEYKSQNLLLTVLSQGTQTGERAVVQFNVTKAPFSSLVDLGMREKMVEQLKEIMLREKGFIVFSSLPGGGLSTTVAMSLRSTDRLLRDFIAVEDAAAREEEIDNVDIHKYDAAAGETPDKFLTSLLRKEPNVVLVRELPNAATVRIICEHAMRDKLFLSTIRSKEAVEAIMRILLLKAPQAELAPALTAVLNQRLVRKLCDKCKEAYAPAPELLQKLGLPAGKIEAFYRPPEQPEEVCEQCLGVGFYGRTSIFELLVVDAALRDAIVKQPKLEVFRQVARKSGHRGLQEEGLVLVAKGVTSLPELMRVLKS